MSGGRRVLRLNLDETSVCLYQGGGKGTLFHSRRGQDPRGEPVQVASRQQRRACMTHVAIICDDPAIQPLLPQYVIGNRVVFSLREWGALRASCPSNVVLVRQQSSWNNTKVLTMIVHRLGVVLRPFLCSVQPVLLMDACRFHFAKPVVAACFSANLWPLFVPARMTWLLQPCDTHLFARYKNQLRCLYQAARARTARGNVNILDFMQCLYTVVRTVMQGHRWSLAFDRDGFGSGQAEVSMSVKRQLGIEGNVGVSAGMPSEEQLRLCFPRRAKLSIASMFPPEISAVALPRQPVGLRLVPRVRPASGDVVPRCACVSYGAGPSRPCSRYMLCSREPRTRGEHRRAKEEERSRHAEVRSAAHSCSFGAGASSGQVLLGALWLHRGCFEQIGSFLAECVCRAAGRLCG